MTDKAESYATFEVTEPATARPTRLLDLPDEPLIRIFLEVSLLSSGPYERWKVDSLESRRRQHLPCSLAPLQLNMRLRRIGRPIWCRTIALPKTATAIDSSLAARVVDFPRLAGSQEVSALSGVLAPLPAAVLQLLPNLTTVHVSEPGTYISSAWTDLLVQLPHLAYLSLIVGKYGDDPFEWRTFSFERLAGLRSLGLAGRLPAHKEKFAYPPHLDSLEVDLVRTVPPDSQFPNTPRLRINAGETAAANIFQCGVHIPFLHARVLVLDFFALGPPAEDSLATFGPQSVDWIARSAQSNFANLAAFLNAFSRLESLSITGFRFHTPAPSDPVELPTLRFADPRDAFPLASEHSVLTSLVRLLILLPVLHVRIRQSETSMRILQLTRSNASVPFEQENLVDLAV